jgi:hypothetical protein
MSDPAVAEILINYLKILDFHNKGMTSENIFLHFK